MATPVAAVNVHEFSEPSVNWLGELAVPDFAWTVNTSARYCSMIGKMPDIFAWEESGDHFANLQILARSVAVRRFSSCLDHIGRYDRDLSKSMRATFDELPLPGKFRFVMAPETFCRISRLRKEPVESISFLCAALNGEAALHGLGPFKKGYFTALGDYYCPYCPESASEDVMFSLKEDGVPGQAPRTAPLLAESVVIDFDSPNAAGAQGSLEIPGQAWSQYPPDEQALVCEKLNEAFAAIKSVSEPAARLIKEHVKVIVPFKAATSHHGSTSQSHVPGRVMLRGIDEVSPALAASALVHEGMHQVLYILEWAGSFVIEHPDAKPPRVESLWTGRDLALHSYIHACFIWYGLSTFWFLAKSFPGVFEPDHLQRELTRSLAGFRGQNPADMLAPYAGMLRYDVLKVAGELQGRLRHILDQIAA